MNKFFTHYFFQYTYFAGSVNSSIVNTNLRFEHSTWLKSKIEEIVEITPEVPDELIKRILEKAKVY